MHELSLALSLLDGIEQECRDRALPRVRAVHLRIGAQAGVSVEALRFAYEVASADTSLADSRLVVEPAAGRELEMIGLEVDP
ncbi:MAG: hydrogenase maturation nickel metallochaperone HypA [Terriglobales bacterium]